MEQTSLERPTEQEYAAYYGTYVDVVPPGNVLGILSEQIHETVALLDPLDDRRAEYRYAPAKWSIKEVVGHLADTERVFSARALHFARRDPAPLPDMDQDQYVAAAQFDRRAIASLLSEWVAVRNASLALFGGLDATVWSNRGIATGLEFSVRSLPYIIAGHELHHRRVIRERYLSGQDSHT